jgi:NAD+ synthase
MNKNLGKGVSNPAKTKAPFNLAALKLDCKSESARLVPFVRHAVGEVLHKQGAVVGVSGGIDSSVTVALCVRALGAKRVVAVLMPEKDSHPKTLELSRLVADSLGIRTFYRDITPVLTGLGFYQEHAEVIRSVIPEYADGWKSKMVISDPTTGTEFAFFSIVAQAPDGKTIKKRLPAEAYLRIVALSNFKQRTRKMLEYHYADRFNYAVGGTSNWLETDQGFFVKLGDGSGDFKPIAHLYKSQIYQLAEYLGVPEEIRRRAPSADIHSLSQGQDEFYFVLPYEKMDVCVYGELHGIPPEKVAEAIGVQADLVTKIYRIISLRRSRTEYLRAQPVYP